MIRTRMIGAVAAVLLVLGGCSDGGNSNGNGGGDDAGPGMDADASVPVDADDDPDATTPDGGGGMDTGDTDEPDPDGHADGGEETGVSCTNGLTPCDGTCVDTATNADYCGNCNTTCSAGEVCSESSCTRGTSNLVLSEVSNRTPRFFEVYNGETSPIDLQGWRVQWQTDDNASGTTVLPSVQIEPDSFVAVYSAEATVDSDDNDELLLDAEVPEYDAIGVRLVDPNGAGADFVRTGSSTVPPAQGDSWMDMTAPPTPSSRLDQSLVRRVYTPDTDSGDDWYLTTPSSATSYCADAGKCGTECVDQSNNRNHCGACGVTCGSDQICREGSCTSANDHLWLTEYRRFPSPGVEIQNPTANPIILENYRLEVGSGAFTFPDRTLAAGEFLFIAAGDGNNGERTVFSGIGRNAFTVSQDVALLDETSNGLDFVRFGNSTTNPPSGTSWFGDSVPGVGTADESARRDTKVLDSDSATDWRIDTPSSPGANCPAGMRSCDGHCIDPQLDNQHCGACGNQCGDHQNCVSGTCQSTGSVVLSEAKNYQREMIEVYNGTDGSVDLSDWTLRWTADNGSGSFSVPSGRTIESGGFVVFLQGAGSNSEERVYTNQEIRWNTEIAITLENDSGTAVDFVRTGGLNTGPPAGTNWTGNNAPNPADDTGESLVRNVYAQDTDSAGDWFIRDDGGSYAAYCERDMGLKTCGSKCVGEQSRFHCGACGRTCPKNRGCFDGKCQPESGALRIAGGGDSGRLEVNHSGVWGTVCDDGFSNDEADVACRQMGYSGGNELANPPEGSGTIWMDNVNCIGDEFYLKDCTFLGWGDENCFHYEDVGVACD